MSAINEAYRVLGDEARRASYDLQLRSGTRSGQVRSGAVSDERSPFAPTTATAPRPAPGPPARIPWKLMAVMATIGIAVVLIGAATRQPAPERPPDGVVGPGSCVEIESNGDAREVNCSGAGDLVVAVVVAFDATCPGGTGPYRDRQGLGIVCVIPESAP
jgi:molecular chaperone DnaJ